MGLSKAHWYGALVICGATLAAYSPALRGAFVLDDDRLLTTNTLVGSSDGLYRIWFTTEAFDYWPVTNTSFWLEWRLWGMNPLGYHVTNLLLHLASSILLWVILQRLAIPGAWLAALLFAVHPVNVESVAWISERKNTLSMLFFLLSVLWYLKADGESTAQKWYWLSLGAFLLAMLSKGSVAVLPALLLVIAWWQRGRIMKRDLARLAPFFVIAIVLALVNVWFQTHGRAVVLRDATFIQRLLGAAAAVWFYLYKAVLPVDLAFIYPQWTIQTNQILWWSSLIGAIALTAGLLWQANSDWGRPLLAAWLFFCIALVPVMGFTDVGFSRYSLVADRYLHIAIIAVVALVAAGWSRWYSRVGPSARWWCIGVASLVVGGFTLLSIQQSRLYADPITLYRAALTKNPSSALLHYNLGTELAGAGRRVEAIPHFEEALRLEPDAPKVQNNLGEALMQTGHPQQAIEHFRELLRQEPKSIEGHNNLGAALAMFGQWPEAIEHYKEVLRLNPNSAEAENNLGLALSNLGREQDAIECYERAIQLRADFPASHYNLGNALAKLGRIPEAISHFEEAIRLRPNRPETHDRLGVVLAESGRMSDAIGQFEQALRLNPDDVEGRMHLATAYAAAGRNADAVTEGQRALRLARARGQTALAAQIEKWLESH